MSNSQNNSNINPSGNATPTPRPGVVIVGEGANQQANPLASQKSTNTKK